ncbi:conserved hypothetical protein [Neospora caninum Liverpool]|uniref:Transmembrane protein n=1 Tax=Neospora caninum (strain Liverpool) TaxID=572307 RepID=F0VB42_NEOCL|nr:conserved hypothetical protein [Neospora caninum Liverpool]CBZ50864.1 conserved hypothetical protein [Neospora caninum Liverpool]CEL68166.1 TPA: hypothetical protein BN1204_039390 [Neospora caninum Liverpool]|eukprot:XP_003880897.1 conserved hypothetical protein [Neospora caninum Liverpool]
MALSFSAVRASRLAVAVCVIGVICASYYGSCEDVIEVVSLGTPKDAAPVGAEDASLLENSLAGEEEYTVAAPSSTQERQVAEVVEKEIPVESTADEENKTDDAEPAAASRRLDTNTEVEPISNESENETSTESDKTTLTADAGVIPAESDNATDAASAEEAVAVEGAESFVAPDASERVLAREATSLEAGEEVETAEFADTPARLLGAEEVVVSDNSEADLPDAEEVALLSENADAAAPTPASEGLTETTGNMDETEAAHNRRLRGSPESAEDAETGVKVGSVTEIDPEENATETGAAEEASESFEAPAEETAASDRRLQETEVRESYKLSETEAHSEEEENENVEGALLEQEEVVKSAASAEGPVNEDASPAVVDTEAERDVEHAETVSATVSQEIAGDKECTAACETNLHWEETQESANAEAGAEPVVDGEEKARELVSEEPSENSEEEPEQSRTPDVDEDASDAVSQFAEVAVEILSDVYSADI